MPTGTVAPYMRLQFFDNSGDPLSSGTLETYEAGTSTAKATYSDVSLSVANPTTITLNSAGRPQVSGSEVAIYLSPGTSYKFILKNSAGSIIWTADNIGAVPASNVDVDLTGTAGEAISAGDLVYLSDGSGSLTAGRWYKADADLPYASIHAVLGFAPAAISSGASGTIRLAGTMTGLSGLAAGSDYYVSATAGGLTATAPTNARLVGRALSTTALAINFGPGWFLDGGEALRVADGRLTLTTATPVTTSDVTAATTLYYTPHVGNRIALFDGSRWKGYAFTELSIAVPATTSQMYDVFVYDNAGTLTLELTAWTNDTTRATALVRQNGVYVKTGATTRRYLGSFRTTGVSGQTEDSLAKRYVWNYYHRLRRVLRVVEATNSWTYSSTTMRQANGSTANQVDVVVGVAEVPISVTAIALASSDNAGDSVMAAIGEDSTTTVPVGCLMTLQGFASTSDTLLATALLNKYPAIGRHFYAWLERAAAVGTTTWYGDNADTFGYQTGLSGFIEG
ncbi:MAG TPA: hypothetical protein VEA16_00145 [Vicinamibacterales bacterium]|nr:hypothetical protein [Vicinamibacterales bacterium]